MSEYMSGQSTEHDPACDKCGGDPAECKCYETKDERIADLERQLAAYKWQPIDTAPKDGAMFIAYQNGSVYECRWVEYPPDLDHQGSAGFLDMTNDGIEYPTHWMPLPEPPTEAILEEKEGK